LAQYTIEMGSGVDLLRLRIPPWEPLYRLSDELQRMRLGTVGAPFSAISAHAGRGLRSLACDGDRG
jgi:hypothetical protein